MTLTLLSRSQDVKDEKCIAAVSVDPVGGPLLVCRISLEPVCGVSLNLHEYTIRTRLRAD